jgi:hypothetical protein
VEEDCGGCWVAVGNLVGRGGGLSRSGGTRLRDVIVELSGHSLLVFVGIPVLVVAVLALLVFASSIANGPRYRPGLSWWAPPVWINGPTATKPDPANLPELPELTSAPGATATAATGVARTLGGASASW